MPYTSSLPGTRSVGDAVAPSADVNLLTAAVTELRAGSPDPRYFVSQKYYPPPIIFSAVTDAGVTTAGRLYALPFPVFATRSFDRIALSINGAGLGAAGTVMRLGIYAATSAGRPGALVLDAGTVAIDSGGDKEIAFTQSLPPGNYFLVFVHNDTGGTLRIRRTANTVFPATGFYGNGNPDINSMALAVSYSGYTATSPLPSTATLAGEASISVDVPLLWARAV